MTPVAADRLVCFNAMACTGRIHDARSQWAYESVGETGVMNAVPTTGSM